MTGGDDGCDDDCDDDCDVEIKIDLMLGRHVFMRRMNRQFFDTYGVISHISENIEGT